MRAYHGRAKPVIITTNLSGEVVLVFKDGKVSRDHCDGANKSRIRVIERTKASMLWPLGLPNCLLQAVGRISPHMYAGLTSWANSFKVDCSIQPLAMQIK